MRHPSAVAVWLCLLALGLGATAALSPASVGLVVALCGGIGLSLFCLLQPHKALTVAFLGVMLAETKFRMRDPGALLAGDVDSQILFELMLYGFIFLILLSNKYARTWRPSKCTPSEALLGSYVGLALLSALWGPDARLTAVRGMQLGLLYALGYISVRVLGPQGMLRALTTAVVGYVLLFALLALLFPWANGTRITQASRIARFTWFAVHPITAAAYASTAALFLATAGLFAPGAWRRRCLGLPLWLPCTLVLLVVFATRSRGALIACLLTLAVLGLRRYVHPWLLRGSSYMVLACAAMVLGLGVSLTTALGQATGETAPLMAFLLRGQAIEEFVTLTGRVELWESVYALFLERPLLGYGYIASRVLLIKVLPWAGEAHNALAESLLNLGGLGTILLWCPLLSALLSSFRHMPRAAGHSRWQQATVCGMLLFLLCHAMVDAAFAGAPGYLVLLLFTAVFAQAKFAQHAYIPPGTLAPGAWPQAGVLQALIALRHRAWLQQRLPEGQRTI